MSMDLATLQTLILLAAQVEADHAHIERIRAELASIKVRLECLEVLAHVREQ